MKGEIMKSIRRAMVGAVAVVFVAFSCIFGEDGEGQVVDERLTRIVQIYVTAARDSLMESWGIFDMVRRITIDPVSKKNFMVRAAPDVIKMTSSMASLAGVCAVCPSCCRNCVVDLNDLVERFTGVVDAFSAITAADPKGEEIILAHLLDESNRLLRQCLAV